MMLTEEEAREKWCPKAIVLGVFKDETNIGWIRSAAGYNRAKLDGPTATGCTCIASACMAWRWEWEMLENGLEAQTDQGFCGAFGVP